MTEKLLLFIQCTLSLVHPKLRLHFSNRLRSLLEFKDSLLKNGTHNPLNMSLSLACAATTAALVFLNLIQSSSFRLTASRNFPFMSEMWPPPFFLFPHSRTKPDQKKNLWDEPTELWPNLFFRLSLISSVLLNSRPGSATFCRKTKRWLYSVSTCTRYTTYAKVSRAQVPAGH